MATWFSGGIGQAFTDFFCLLLLHLSVSELMITGVIGWWELLDAPCFVFSRYPYFHCSLSACLDLLGLIWGIVLFVEVAPFDLGPIGRLEFW